jgi:hypothetical protein
MKPQLPVEQLLRWRLARAEAEAPPAPRGAQLLELVRPWWETWPERFQRLAGRLSQLDVAYGHAMADSRRTPIEHPVPVMIVRDSSEAESSARVLYFNIRDKQLRLRFQLSTSPDMSELAYEATFVSRSTSKPLFSSSAQRSANGDYSITEGLSAELVEKWSSLKVTDEMPFRLILRPLDGSS